MKLFRKLWKLIVCGVLIWESILAGIWVQSTSKYTTVTSQEDYFSESTVSFTFGALQGPISNNYYFLTKLSTSSQTAWRRVTMDDDIVWISAFSTTPTMNSLAIDSQEQSVYFVLGGSNFDVMKLSAISGVIEKTLRL